MLGLSANSYNPSYETPTLPLKAELPWGFP